jgi:hypothetical protein
MHRGEIWWFIRTLKEQLLWVRTIQNVEELRCSLAEADSVRVMFDGLYPEIRERHRRQS